MIRPFHGLIFFLTAAFAAVAQDPAAPAAASGGLAGAIEGFNHWVADRGTLGLVLFVVAYIVTTVLLIPGSLLTLGAGAVFGVVKGSIAVSIGSTVGAALAFLISRYLLRGAVAARALQNRRFAAIDRAIGEQGWKIVGLLRLSPALPFSVSNYFYGVTAVRFWPYVIASWIGMMPGTVMYVYLGHAGKRAVETAAGTAAAGSLGQQLLFWIGLAATVAVTVYITRIAKQAIDRVDLDEPQQEPANA